MDGPQDQGRSPAKLTTLYVGIGYPETWIDYSAYEVKADDIFGNIWRGSLFPISPPGGAAGSAGRSPRMVDGSADRERRESAVAKRPQLPGCDSAAALLRSQSACRHNYGAIGSVIGHEISHTFDTEGSAFDSKGRVRNWWTPADLAHFEAATAKLAAQYDAYMPFPDLHVNGKQTLAENIADVAGIAASFDGYHASLEGKTAPEQDGFSGDQQFFIAFGQNYASKTRDAALRQQVMVDPHSPAEFRADTVRNIDAWYSSFDVKPGQTLYLAPGRTACASGDPEQRPPRIPTRELVRGADSLLSRGFQEVSGQNAAQSRPMFKLSTDFPAPSVAKSLTSRSKHVLILIRSMLVLIPRMGTVPTSWPEFVSLRSAPASNCSRRAYCERRI